MVIITMGTLVEKRWNMPFPIDNPPLLDQIPRGNNYHANISVVIITTGTLV